MDPAGGFLGASRTDYVMIEHRMLGLDLGTEPLPSYPNFLTVWREREVGVVSTVSTVDGTDHVHGTASGMKHVGTNRGGVLRGAGAGGSLRGDMVEAFERRGRIHGDVPSGPSSVRHVAACGRE